MGTVEEGYIPPMDDNGNRLDDIPFYTEQELNVYKSTLCTNAATAHLQLKNWGYVREDATRALEFNSTNIKAWYRLAKAHAMLKHWEKAGDAIDSGLELEKNNKELLLLQKTCSKQVQRARQERQKRQRARAERVVKVKQVWNHCKEYNIQLGRVALVSSVTEDEEEENEHADAEENRWHTHFPHSGVIASKKEEWTWPCMFIYPSHKQSDFIPHFAESEMLAMRMAEIFPELNDTDKETAMPWDYNNEFQCSQLAVYFEVHCSSSDDDEVIHPESVERLKDLASTMKFYEASRALKGDDGPESEQFARCIERKHLHTQRKRWKKKHGSLWSKSKPNDVVRVHPAVTLHQILTDERFIVPNFLVTFQLFPEHHPAHDSYLQEHNCIGILNPENLTP